MKSGRQKVTNRQAVFKPRTRKDDNDELSLELIISARKSGQLSLTGRGMASVPNKVWTLDELTREELDELRREIDFNNEKDCWWEHEPLRSLNLSSNSLVSLDPQIKNLLDLICLDLHDNLLGTLPPEVGKLKSLKKLDLSFNKLKTLPIEFFELIELRQLELKNNILRELDSAVGDLIMLESLNLSCNDLTDLPIGMGYLVRLNTLDLSHNMLKELPPDITSMRVLKRLDASFNHLEILPPLGELRKAEIFVFNTNNLKTFPDISGCTSLREIHLTNNNITEIDGTCLEGMSQLKVLTLGSNKIEFIPEEMIYLLNLEHLDFSHNNISTIPNCIGIMPNLHNFIIDGNKLQNVRRDIVQCGTPRILRHLRQNANASNIEIRDCSSPICDEHIFPEKYAMKNARLLSLIGKNILQLPDSVLEDARDAGVTCIDLSRNILHELPSVMSHVTTVTDLKLSCNQFTEIPEWISELQQIQYLDLNRNRLMSLPESIRSLEHLREINISFNRFVNIPQCIYEIIHLQILIASDNQIANIDVPALSKLRRLATLDLSNNNIGYVPPELGNLTHLRTLLLSGNFFKQPRHTTLMKGTDEILAYLRDKIPV